MQSHWVCNISGHQEWDHLSDSRESELCVHVCSREGEHGNNLFVGVCVHACMRACVCVCACVQRLAGVNEQGLLESPHHKRRKKKKRKSQVVRGLESQPEEADTEELANEDGVSYLMCVCDQVFTSDCS